MSISRESNLGVIRAAALSCGGLALGVCLTAGPAPAQVQESLFRAADGTSYQVLSASAFGGGAENVRITTISGGLAGAGSCASVAFGPGDPASAGSGVVPPGQSLVPFASVRRTAIITGADVSFISFSPTYGGRVTIGNPMGAIVNVCGAGFDCSGHPNVQGLHALDSSLGGVPAACIAQNLNAGCDGGILRDAFAFGITASSPPLCDSPATVDSTLCASPPADGFTLADNQAIVFVYDGGAGSGMAVSAAGFGVTTDGANPIGCAANSIVSASADNDSQPAPPPPTATPLPGGPCAPTPLAGCRSAGKSVLQLSRDGMTGVKDKLLWKWVKGAATSLGDLGSPTTSTTYTVCLYDGSGGAEVVSIPAGSAWSGGATGFKLSDSSGSPDGVQKVLLKSGAAGKSKILIKGRGANLPDALTPTLALPVTAQLVNDGNSVCYESVFAVAVVNDSGRFKAKAP